MISNFTENKKHSAVVIQGRFFLVGPVRRICTRFYVPEKKKQKKIDLENNYSVTTSNREENNLNNRKTDYKVLDNEQL